ncbi:MAG: alpha-amylase family glycosyl hydrolase [Bacteroidia bacterium]|nr:alpha-amylase family glycosyl hydrolase [Bacteroidia bacterium]
MKRTTYLLVLALLGFISCKNEPTTAPVVETTDTTVYATFPEWSRNATIYEVNLRQYTPSGTFNEFATHIPRLKAMGVDILWLMPVFEIGEKNRKGSLGSYYSVKDYLQVNPEHGTVEDLRNLVAQVHAAGMYLILDWVPNHTSWDHAWTTQHPDWYMKDDKGNFKPPVADWEDVIHLDYSNKEMRQAMIDAMKYWIVECDIDGYRCDVAHMIPVDFWNDCRQQLNKTREVFMLAEAEIPVQHSAFEMSYAWKFHGLLNEIAKGEKNASAIDEYYATWENDTFPEYAYRMQFITNHDENSWSGTEFERMGDGYKTFAVLALTLPGMPLLYTGQEVGLNRRLKFFEKDVIEWKEHPDAAFYTTLLKFNKENPAMWNGEYGGKMTKINNEKSEDVYTFFTEKENNKVLVMVNLSAEEQTFSCEGDAHTGSYKDVFTGESVEIKPAESYTLAPWGYRLLSK